MKYAFIKKGATINHPTVGRLESSKVYEITDEEAAMIKDLRGIMIATEFVTAENRIV